MEASQSLGETASFVSERLSQRAVRRRSLEVLRNKYNLSSELIQEVQNYWDRQAALEYTTGEIEDKVKACLGELKQAANKFAALRETMQNSTPSAASLKALCGYCDEWTSLFDNNFLDRDFLDLVCVVIWRSTQWLNDNRPKKGDLRCT